MSDEIENEFDNDIDLNEEENRKKQDIKVGDRVMFEGPYDTGAAKVVEVKPTACKIDTGRKQFWIKKVDLELL